MELITWKWKLVNAETGEQLKSGIVKTSASGTWKDARGKAFVQLGKPPLFGIKIKVSKC